MALRFRATPLRRSFARERLITEYWYLCRRAARRFMRRGLDRSDLEQTGALGLIKAADRYDPNQRAPFEAYAWLLIVGELMHYVRDSERPLRAPRTVRELERRWSSAERDLWTLFGREPREHEVIQLLGSTTRDAEEVRRYRASSRVLSFEILQAAEHRGAPGAFDDLIDRLTVAGLLRSLSPLQRQIVVAIHLEGVSVVELSTRLGYSRRHVTRLHRAAMESLRRASGVAARSGDERITDVPISDRR